MKKKKKLISLFLLVAMLMTTGILSVSVSAVEGSYNNFIVSGTVSKDTTAIVNNNKDHTYYWVWAAPPSSGRNRIVHRGFLHNSDHVKRSDEILVYEDTTNQAASQTTKYYYYHFNVRRHYDTDDYATISGTWGWMY